MAPKPLDYATTRLAARHHVVPPFGWPSVFLLTLAAVAVGYAIHVRDGEYTARAIRWVAVALTACAGAVVLRPLISRPRGPRVVVAALTIGLAFQFYQLIVSPPGGWNYWSNDVRFGDADRLWLFYTGVFAAAALTVPVALGIRGARRVVLPLLLVTHFLSGVWMIRASPDPDIDVFIFQQEGSRALLRGDNPYAITFPDIYAGRG